MKVNLTAKDLIEFEDEIDRLFMEKRIRAPVHYDSNSEEQLIHIFENYVNEEDWCCGSWRMHYRSLLKGVPREKMIEAILEGHSIGLCFPEYKVIASAIVGGIIPIAVGAAMGIKRQVGSNKVVCFVGDMTSETGIFHECYKYSTNHKLPILFVVENNFSSVCTDTREVWGLDKFTYQPDNHEFVTKVADNLLYYEYRSKFPHAGRGQRIQF